jgi:hypothetical protein
MVHTFYIKNNAKISAHYTWKIAEKGFKMTFVMSKLAMIYSREIILEIFFAKNHCEIQVRTILICALYSIKYNIFHSYKTTYLNKVNHTETFIKGSLH